MELERLRAGQRRAALRADLGDGGVQHGRALLERGPERLLLGVRLLGDAREGLGDLRVAVRHQVAGDRQQGGESRVRVPELADGADGAAQHPAQDVTAPLVGGGDPVGQQHQGGADVVGDDAEADVGGGVGAVAGPGQLGGGVQDRAGLVDLVEVGLVLEEGGHPLQPHAGVDVAVREFAEDRVPRLAVPLAAFVLHEDEVPELHEAVLVHGRAALRAEGRAPVVVQLGGGAAGAGDAHGPEVVLVAPVHDPRVGQPGGPAPQGAGLGVGVVDGDPDPGRVQAVAAVGDGVVDSSQARAIASSLK